MLARTARLMRQEFDILRTAQVVTLALPFVLPRHLLLASESGSRIFPLCHHGQLPCLRVLFHD